MQSGIAGTPTQTTASEVLGASPSTVSPSNPPIKAEAPKAPSTDEKISPKIQALIQREKAALEIERRAKAQSTEVQNRLKEIEAREARVKEFESLKQTNPRKALELLGMSYADLTQVELQDGQVPADIKVKQVEDRLESIIKSQEEEKRREEEAQKLERERDTQKVLDSFRGEIQSYIKSNANRYELIQFEQNEDLVFDVIQENYNRTLQSKLAEAEKNGQPTDDIRGEVWTIAQAADKIEEKLEQKYQKARELAKVKTLLAQRQERSSVVDKPKLFTPQPRQTPKTLTNNMSATPASAPKNRVITDDERIAKAIAYAKGIRP